MFSCDKQETELENNKALTAKTQNNPYSFNVKVNNGILTFTTREDFDNAITYLNENSPESFKEFEENLNYKSMRSVTTEEAREKIGIYDDLLATLINPEAMIEINGSVFKLDALNETVTMVNSKDFEDKSSFASRNAYNFSTHDDILSILDGTDEGEADSDFRGGKCKKNKVGPIYFYGPNNFKIRYKSVYQSSGFMRSLIFKIKKLSGGNDYIGLKTDGYNYYTYKKFGKTRKVNIPYRNKGGGDRVYKYRPYSSSRRLKAYRFSIIPKVGEGYRPVVTLTCNN